MFTHNGDDRLGYCHQAENVRAVFAVIFFNDLPSNLLRVIVLQFGLDFRNQFLVTAGYTDQIFGLTHLLGFKFAPRIRDLSDSKLFTIDKASEYPKLEAILRGQINTKVIKENYQDVLRLAHSIKEGKVSASLIMGKLGSYSRQNSLATALREMGRIEKTIFILNYISDESLRRKI